MDNKTSELKSYPPSLRERIAQGASWAFGLGDETRDTARAGHQFAGAFDILAAPFTYGHDSARAAHRGDYWSAAGNAGLAALGLPLVPAVSRTAALVGRTPYSRVPGLPKEINLPSGETLPAEPIPGLVDAASSYMTSKGLKHEVPEAFAKVDPARAEQIAKVYDGAIDSPATPEVAGAFQKMADETLDQYRGLKGAGYDFRFMGKDEAGNVVDPYSASPALGYKDLANNQRLEVFPTEAGFGTMNEASNLNPLLKQSGEYFGDQPATYNDLFRAVHDAYGHFGYGNAFFRAPGEERAWQLHSMMYSPEARRAMTTETRGQNSWVNYGPFGANNRSSSGADTVFADQKTALLPEWVAEEGLPKAYQGGLTIPRPEGVMPGPSGAFSEEGR